MTLRAREVLAECELALQDFRDSGSTPYWRLRWVALVAILRAVGYVLNEIDRKRSEALSKAIDAAWKKPRPSIFTEFIEQERNNAVHAYQICAQMDVRVKPATAEMQTQCTQLTDARGRNAGEPPNYASFIHMGIYKGRSAVDVCREAIDYWHSYLDEIDAAVARASSTP
jgi:hypothetical protein